MMELKIHDPKEPENKDETPLLPQDNDDGKNKNQQYVMPKHLLSGSSSETREEAVDARLRIQEEKINNLLSKFDQLFENHFKR